MHVHNETVKGVKKNKQIFAHNYFFSVTELCFFKFPHAHSSVIYELTTFLKRTHEIKVLNSFNWLNLGSNICL